MPYTIMTSWLFCVSSCSLHLIGNAVAWLQMSASQERIQQLEAENAQLREAASKRTQALAQARHFIENNLQRSMSMLKDSTDSHDAQGNGVQASSAKKSNTH